MVNIDPQQENSLKNTRYMVLDSYITFKAHVSTFFGVLRVLKVSQD